MASEPLRVAIIGDHDSIIGFTTVGVVPFDASTAEEAKKHLDEIFHGDMKGKFGVVFIVEDLAIPLSDYIFELKNRFKTPLITIVPGMKGSSGLQRELIRKKIERAIGFDIFGAKE